MISGDKKGQVCVWAVDSRGSLSPLRQYRKKGEISSAVFCTIPATWNSGGNNTENGIKGFSLRSFGDVRRAELKSSSPPFFFGTDRGAVIYANDQGQCNDVQQLSSSIDTMLYFEERQRLIIVTRSLLLTQYQVAEDGKVTRVMQVKLSVAGDVAERGLKNVEWASPGLLVMATQEKMVRLLDLAADASYNLSLSALGNIVERSDKVISVAFGPLDRHLAVGTQGGCIGIWKFVGGARDISGSRSVTLPTSNDDWELFYKTALPSPVHELNWYTGQGTLGAVTDDGAVILSETIMHSGMCGDLFVVQANSHDVNIHVNNDVWTESTDMVVRGLSVSSSAFVVWSGKQARVFTVDPHMLRCEPLSAFSCTAQSIVIGDSLNLVEDTLFICDGTQVKITNFSGTQKGNINFSDSEGIPELLDLNGQYLGVATSKMTLKVFDVHAPTKPKVLGSGGKFDPTVESIQDGNMPGHAQGLAFGSSSPPSSGKFGRRGVGGSSPGGITANNKDNKIFPGTGKKTGSVGTSVGSSNAVRNIRVNCDGSRIALLADVVEGAMKVRRPHTLLYVYDRNKGDTNSFDFNSYKRCPASIHWDVTDDRMLCVEANKNKSVIHKEPERGSEGKEEEKSEMGKQQQDDGEMETSEVEVYLFFATTEHGLLMQDSFPRKQPYGRMLGINVPKLHFRDLGSHKAVSESDERGESKYDSKDNKGDVQSEVFSKVMRDFVGLSEVDEITKAALLDFSYFLTLGKLDEAYKSVKNIDNPSIWENMAHMCVKTKRLDVAEVCLGNMGHARGAAAVRVSKRDGDTVEATIGVLAIHLGLLDDAARLFREAGRYDKLNQLYQSAGIWDKAIKIAESHDKIHLKNTHHFYAKHLESVGDTSDAILHYELAQTHVTEVPRMLFELDRMDELESYVQRSDNADMLKWWAKYLESNERYDKAKKYYAKAEDFLSVVRILCFKGDFESAFAIVSETNDRAAAYHIARQLEQRGEKDTAIEYFSKSGCYNHSIRLAREAGLDAELLKYAVKSTKSSMLDCAQYFEKKDELDKAVQLYHKGGNLNKALDLCFRAGAEGAGPKNKLSAVNRNAAVFEMLNAIAADLGAHSNPETLAKCADFLVEHKQYERAVELYVMAKKFVQAIDMCLQNRVTISDDMVDKMTPPVLGTKDEEGNEIGVSDSDRKNLLMDIGKALKLQGSYTLASKKYTQAGDRVRAIKCLVRAGDTKAVIQFANISRNAEIYKLAANYLQQMNWRESVEIMKAIITFYTKAKSFEQLAGFYDSCAQVEIDDYRDYEKAVGALREGTKHLAKSDTRSAADMLARFEERIALIEKFVSCFLYLFYFIMHPKEILLTLLCPSFLILHPYISLSFLRK